MRGGRLSPLQALLALLAVLDVPQPVRIVRLAAIILSWERRNEATHDFEWVFALRHAEMDGYLVYGEGHTWRRGRTLPPMPESWKTMALVALERARTHDTEVTRLVAEVKR